MTFDHPELFSTNNLNCSERLAMNGLEQSFPLPSLGVGHSPITSECTRHGPSLDLTLL